MLGKYYLNINNMTIRIYTKEDCPECVRIKTQYKQDWIKFEEVSAMENLDYLLSKWVMALPYVENI